MKAIEDVISEYFKLIPDGDLYRAQCPFHKEPPPGSFYVNPLMELAYCNTCKWTGNAVAFVHAIEQSTTPSMTVIAEMLRRDE